MAYLLPSRFLTLSAALLLSGCCANDVCDCKDAQEDVIQFRFSSGFSTADLDTVLVQRYPLVITPATKPETVTLIRAASRVYDNIELNNTTPFAQVGAARLNNYKYVVRYYATPRQRRSAIALIVDKVDLKGSFGGGNSTGCCTCYTNLSKAISFRKDSTFAEAADSTRDLKATPTPTFTIRK
ncbi:hypothetical protein [Hymenobacter rubidus]|uniref:hypothetical protein n=1 Tax=Hymenobacter rubidus TaxID=1441626 RepID=UPI00191F370A|nr:hypothetical protein [Hymenobacter rubidus]